MLTPVAAWPHCPPAPSFCTSACPHPLCRVEYWEPGCPPPVYGSGPEDEQFKQERHVVLVTCLPARTTALTCRGPRRQRQQPRLCWRWWPLSRVQGSSRHSGRGGLTVRCLGSRPGESSRSVQPAASHLVLSALLCRSRRRNSPRFGERHHRQVCEPAAEHGRCPCRRAQHPRVTTGGSGGPAAQGRRMLLAGKASIRLPRQRPVQQILSPLLPLLARAILAHARAAGAAAAAR